MTSAAQPLNDIACAIGQRDLGKVQLMIESGLVDVNARLPFRPKNPSLLHFAGGRVEIIEFLLNAGANVNATNNHGETACHLAAKVSDAEWLAMLIAHGAALDRDDCDGRTPLQVALFFANASRQVVSMLVKAGSPLGPDTFWPLASASCACIQALIDRGIVVSKLRDIVGRTPLHLVDVDDDEGIAMMNMLVNVCGVDVNARSDQGETSCNDAASGGGQANLRKLRWLIEAGADVDISNNIGLSPLYMACSRMSIDQIEMMLILLAAGANVHALTAKGDTVCHRVAQSIDNRTVHVTRVMQFLLAAGADVDTANPSGITPRQLLRTHCQAVLEPSAIDLAGHLIAKTRLDFVRNRALQVCIGLQSRGLDALQMCEILLHACGPLAPIIPFHRWWKIATTVKHFSRVAQE